MNMKRLMSINMLAMSLLFSSISTAQVPVDFSHRYDLFQTLASNTNHIYTFNQVPKTFDKSEIFVYDLEGKQLNRFEFQAKRGVTFLGANTMGENTVFKIEGAQGYEILVVNKAGQEIGRRTFDLEDKIRSFDIVTNDLGLTAIYEVKRKKVGVGIVVVHLDTKLDSTWGYENFREDGKYFYYGADLNKDGSLAMLLKKGNTNAYSLCLIGPSGNEKALVDIDIKGLSKYSPYLFQYHSETEILLVADYGSTSEETFQGYPLGMHILKLNAGDGSEVSSSTLSFNEVQQAVGDKHGEKNDIPVHQVGPALRVLDVQTVKGKAALICESYTVGERQQSVPSTTEGMAPTVTYFKQVRLMDFYLLDIDAPKTAIHRIWKPSRVIELEAGTFGSSDVLCAMLKRNGLFSYQGMAGEKLVVRGYGQMFHYFNTIPIDHTSEPLKNRVFFGPKLNCQPSQMPPQMSYTKEFGSSSLSGNLTREGLLKAGNSFLLFNYNTTTNQLNFSKLNLN